MLGKGFFFDRKHKFHSHTEPDIETPGKKLKNLILKLGNTFSFLQLAPAPPDLVEGSYKLIQVT